MTSGAPDYRGLPVHAMFIDPSTGVETAHPAEGLPYKEDILSKTFTAVADQTADQKDWTATDWGADKEFFFVRAILLVQDASEFMTKRGQGFGVQLGPTGKAVFFSESFTGYQIRPINYVDNWWRIRQTIYGRGRVAADDTLRFTFTNLTGVELDIFSITIGGIPISLTTP